MTDLPPPSTKKLGLVIDLDTCVGCQACATGCKQWNSGGMAGPFGIVRLHDFRDWAQRQAACHDYSCHRGP